MSESLNDLNLDAGLVATLYRRSIVLPDAPAPSAAPRPASPAAVKFLGNNSRNITVLVNDGAHTFLSDEEMHVLTKILEACRLNIGDVAIVNTAAQALPFDHIFGHLATRKAISFGNGTGAALFSIAEVAGVPLLTAPALSAMTDHAPDAKPVKVKLWAQLKQLFGL